MYPTSLPWLIRSKRLGASIKFASKLPPAGPVGSTENLIISPGSALDILFAPLLYLPAGCFARKAYCPFEGIYSKYLPSQTAL